FSSRWRHTSFRRHWSSGVRSSHRDEGSAVPHSPLFHSEALVIPTPHACCHPEERSDEGSAVPHSPLRSIPRPLSSRRPTLVVIPRSAATRDLQSPTHPYVPFRGPCHPDAPRLLSSRGAQRRGICSSPLTLTFHSEALVIPTPHACCHPEERSDEGSAVPHSPLFHSE